MRVYNAIVSFYRPILVETALITLTALIGGLIVAFGGWLAAVALLIGGVAVAILLRNMAWGLWGTIAVVTLLPFAAVPIDLGLKPTFLDCGLGAFIGVWFLRLITSRQKRVVTSPVTVPVLLFLLIALFSFVFGMGNGALTPTILRKFAELLLSIGTVLVIVDYCRHLEQVVDVARVLIWTTGLTSLIAIIFWLLPDELTNTLLNGLVRLDYPGGWVIRYIEENPALSERAIGTNIDPNALGGLLALFGAVMVPQLFSHRPILSRRTLYFSFLCTLIALLLTFSRGAFLALGTAIAFLALLRYRQLIPIALVGIALLFILPFTQAYVLRLVQGLMFWEFNRTDLASQMRLGEYRDAWALIVRYPFFGVGFLGSPDLNLYLGVANVYLSIAQQMGLLGLAAFFAILGGVGWNGATQYQAIKKNEQLFTLWLGFMAAIISGLTAGLFDHYLFNTEFHHTVTAFWLMVGIVAALNRLVAQGEG